MFYIGPMLHLNYSRILPFLVPESAKTSQAVVALKKLGFDQLVFAPICTSGFFIVINTLEGNGPAKGIADLKAKLWETLLVNWKIWVPANFVNFALVPIPYQVLWANCVSILFNACLSFIHNKDKTSGTA